ncbi:MAG: hypothetical protein ACLQDV_03605 [Candidatus Binataceae bacterium]
MFRTGGFSASFLPFVGQRRDVAQQHPLAIVADIKPEGEQALRQTLEHIGSALRAHNEILFHNTQTVHYAAWLILPGVQHDCGDADSPARLLLETNYDGDLDQHLDDLVSHCGSAFDRIYAYCEGYPATGCATRELVLTFLKERYRLTSSNPTAYYVAFPGRTVADIRNAIVVYEHARDFLDNRRPQCVSQEQIHEELIAYFRTLPQYQRPRLCRVTQRGQKWKLAFNLIAPTLLCTLLVGTLFYFKWFKIAISLLLLPILYLLILLLAARCQEIIEKRRTRRCEEKIGKQCARSRDSTRHDEEFHLLNVGPQNHLCTLATLRIGRFRQFLIRQALLLGRVLTRYIFILGKLDLMPTIHFARWILIGNEVLFLSNYDGSFSSYFADFSDQAWGVNLVWGNTQGFPPTRFLYLDGARDLDAFETQALSHFYPAPVFYSAYEGYPVQNILRYLEFRDALARAV